MQLGRLRRFSPSRRVLLIAAVVVVLTALCAAGAFKVGPAEVAVTRAGDGIGSIYGPGWHWRLPFTARPARLPQAAVPYAAELELPGAAGPVVVAVSGRFAVEKGREEAWVRAAGWRPFLDGVLAVLRAGLANEARGLPPERIFGREAQQRFQQKALAALAAAGAQVEQVAVHVPAERNAPAAEAARASVTALAHPTGRKLLVVGWDGADWLIIRPLLQQGKMPNLKALMARGASGELLAIKPLLSPLIWTTVATGKPATEHGVADFLVKDAQSGELVPIGSDARRVHALWTILPTFGLRTDVVGWWATWPAEQTRGTLVTDRVAYQLFQLNEDRSGYGKVYPPQAWDWIRGELVTADRIGYDEARRFVDIDAQEYQRLWDGLPPERRQEERVNHLRKVLATTRSYHKITLSLLDQQADLTMAYYEGTDTVGHLFARYLPPPLPGVKPEELRRYENALPAFYSWADQLLGELVAKAGPDTTVLLMSDHGFFTGEARPAADPSDFTAGAPQWHRLHGILVAAGPGIPRGEVHDATVLDIAPTVLSLLGLPVPRDMPGRVLFGGSGARALASYELLPRAAVSAAPRTAGLDKERLRELAALGYISADAARGATTGQPVSSAPAGSAPGAQGTEAFATEAYNLGRMYQDRGELEAARGQYRTAVDRMPTFGLGWAALAQAAELQGRHGEAFDTLVEGFAHSPSMPLGGITGLVDLGEKAGRLDDAARTLEGLPAVYKGQSGYHAAWGLYYEKKGQVVEALRAFQRALEVDPLDELAVDRTVALLRQVGRERDAQAFLAEAVARAHGSVQSLNQLAVVALRQGWGRMAEGIFRGVLKSDPGNPGVLANLAVSLGQQRRMKEASDVMRESVRRDPGEAQNHFNLGAMLAEQGRWDEALAAFEQARAHGLRNARVQVAIAKMRFRMGDREGSRRELEQAVALDPANDEARTLLSELR